MRRIQFLSGFLALFVPVPLFASSVITVQSAVLAPNSSTPQAVRVLVSGTDTNITGLDLYAQIGDGGTANSGTLAGPAFATSATNASAGGDLVGTAAVPTLFYSNNSGQNSDPSNVNHPLIFDAKVATSSGAVSDTATPQLLATLYVVTSGVSSGTFSLDLNNVAAHLGGPFTTDLSATGGSFDTVVINNGTILVPEPSSFALALLIGVLWLSRRNRREHAPGLSVRATN